jgi:hypothetical protein
MATLTASRTGARRVTVCGERRGAFARWPRPPRGALRRNGHGSRCPLTTGIPGPGWAHYGFVEDDGITVIEIWESKAQHDKWFDPTVRSLLPPNTPEPEFWEIRTSRTK